MHASYENDRNAFYEIFKKMKNDSISKKNSVFATITSIDEDNEDDPFSNKCEFNFYNCKDVNCRNVFICK